MRTDKDRWLGKLDDRCERIHQKLDAMDAKWTRYCRWILRLQALTFALVALEAFTR